MPSTESSGSRIPAAAAAGSSRDGATASVRDKVPSDASVVAGPGLFFFALVNPLCGLYLTHSDRLRRSLPRHKWLSRRYPKMAWSTFFDGEDDENHTSTGPVTSSQREGDQAAGVGEVPSQDEPSPSPGGSSPPTSTQNAFGSAALKEKMLSPIPASGRHIALADLRIQTLRSESASEQATAATGDMTAPSSNANNYAGKGQVKGGHQQQQGVRSRSTTTAKSPIASTGSENQSSEVLTPTLSKQALQTQLSVFASPDEQDVRPASDHHVDNSFYLIGATHETADSFMRDGQIYDLFGGVQDNSVGIQAEEDIFDLYREAAGFDYRACMFSMVYRNAPFYGRVEECSMTKMTSTTASTRTPGSEEEVEKAGPPPFSLPSATWPHQLFLRLQQEVQQASCKRVCLLSAGFAHLALSGLH
ncbi:unnamed protein product, partial [Amoebophrya sp. A120]|eukprot:GSA120T00000110001.1